MTTTKLSPEQVAEAIRKRVVDVHEDATGWTYVFEPGTKTVKNDNEED